jgi:hypothetical protein
VLEHHRERRAAAVLRDWQVRRDACAALVDTARTYTGATDPGLLTGPGETVYLRVDDAQLVEERRGRGTYVGHSQGVSVPVARIGGRQIRYRVGASRGHYVQGEPVATAIDTGTAFVTSSRVVFRGTAQTRECAYTKLLAVEHDPADGTTTLSVSNRRTPTTIHYGPSCAPTVEFRLDLALARFRGTLDEFVAGLEADLAAVEAAHPPDAPATGGGGGSDPAAPGALPTPPTGAGGAPVQAPAAGAAVAPDTGSVADPAGGAGAVGAVAAGWYPDPWAVAPLRWWTGSAWGWQTVDPSAPHPT